MGVEHYYAYYEQDNYEESDDYSLSTDGDETLVKHYDEEFY